jgi:hypothetical protein
MFGNKERSMGESVKAVCALVLVVASVAAAVAWSASQPDAIAWCFRIGGPILALLAVGLILKLHFRADLAPDYLRKQAGNYFNRGGFCFAFGATAVDGICYLDAYFQNQQDQACLGRIALRPARGFFLGRAKTETVTFEIDCEPAVFGVARIAIPLPQKLQGKRQSFEVGASVHYPRGKGRRLRFRDGIFLRTNSNFGDTFGTALTVAGAATGQIVLSKPATTTIDLPVGAVEDLPDDVKPEIKTLWKLGDPPLEQDG